MLRAYAGGPSPVVEARFADSTHVSGGQASGSRDPQRAGQVRVWATVIGSGGVNETRRKASDRQAKWEASAGRTARPTPLGNVSEKKRQPRQKPLVEASCPFSGPCSGCASVPPKLAVYVYRLPKNLTHNLDRCRLTSDSQLQSLRAVYQPLLSCTDSHPSFLDWRSRCGAECKKAYERYEGGYEQYAPELVIPQLFRASEYHVSDPRRAHFFLVPFQGVSAIHCAQRRFGHTPPHFCPPGAPSQLVRFTRFKKDPDAAQRTNEEYMAVIDFVRRSGPWFDRKDGADHIWIFPSGRGPSIFPDWQSHIANGIFLSPEGDERSGRMQPQGKDIVVPGYRNISRVPSSLLERVRTSAETVRPTFLFFRGSTWSHRPGETNYGEGVRLTLQRALSTFQLPRHISVERSLSPLKVTPRLKKQRAIFSEDPVSLPLYLEEMSLSDFCLCPMGSTSWTLRMCAHHPSPPPRPCRSPTRAACPN